MPLKIQLWVEVDQNWLGHHDWDGDNIIIRSMPLFVQQTKLNTAQINH